MSYSDWQLFRIRDALRAYHQFERGIDENDAFTWKDVSEAIYEYTNTRIDPERLRQFVVGINDKKGGRHYPCPKGQRLESIVSFVTNEELDLLSRDELNEFMPSHQAAGRLLEYLKQDFDQERMVPPSKLQGTYQVNLYNDIRYLSSRKLSLEQCSEADAIPVVEVEHFYEDTPEFSKSLANYAMGVGPEPRPSTYIKYGGWAILTPEDNLLFYLKKERNGMNRYYFTIASELSIWTDAPQTRLVLLHHDFPLELSTEDTDKYGITESIIKEVRNKIIYFDKIS